jgi:hypothetical protein
LVAGLPINQEPPRTMLHKLAPVFVRGMLCVRDGNVMEFCVFPGSVALSVGALQPRATDCGLRIADCRLRTADAHDRSTRLDQGSTGQLLVLLLVNGNLEREDEKRARAC